MVAPLNIAGQRFNALIAIERAGSDKHCRWATAHVQRINQRRVAQWQSL